MLIDYVVVHNLIIKLVCVCVCVCVTVYVYMYMPVCV